MIKCNCEWRWTVIILGSSLIVTACKISSTATSNLAPPVGNSSDLQYVVFTHNEGKTNLNDKIFLYKVREDGAGMTAVATSGQSNNFQAVSPSGRVIYQNVDISGFSTLYSVAADGSAPIPLLTSSSEYWVDAVTPDNHVILKRVFGPFPQNWDLHSVPADGSLPPVVLANTAQYEYFFAATPDNRVIFTTSDITQPIKSIKADGSGLVLLDTQAGTNPNITPDGHVIYSKTTPDVHLDLYSAVADGSAPATILDATPSSDKIFVGATADNRVIYELISGVGRDLWIVNPDGSGRVQLTHTPEQEYFAAPLEDGRIVFEIVVNNQRDVYVINPDGTGLVPLATSSDDERVVGVYKSERIVYRRVVNGQNDLYSVKPDGSGTVVLADTPTADDSFRAITRSGRVIYETGELSLNLYSVFLDGSGNIPIADSPQHDTFGGLL